MINDDPTLRQLLAEYLNRHGYDTLLAPDATDLASRITRYVPDLLVLDQMLPGSDDTDACRRLREQGEDIPVILLTTRDEAVDRIIGLKADADDYLGKPFDPRELLARIEAVLRRKRGPSALTKDAHVCFGPFVFDPVTRQLLRDGLTVKLTGGEINLLEALVRNAGKPLSRERLLVLARDDEVGERNDRAIDIAVLRLRRAIEDDPKEPPLDSNRLGHRLPLFALMNAARTLLPRSLLPRSLRARLILLVLGAVLLAQAATLTTVSYFRHKFMEDVAIGYIVTTIRTLRAAVSQVPAEDRANFVRNASQNQWRLWARTLPADAKLQRFNGPRHASRNRPKPAPEPSPDESARPRHSSKTDDMRSNLRVLVRQLNERLNDGNRVALSHGSTPEIFISPAPNFDSEDVPDLREWLVIPLERLDSPVATPLIAAWLGGLGIILLFAVGLSWHITRPITRLAEAADQLASGQPQRVEPSGPDEIRILGECFNAMLDALAESESVRRTLLAGLPHDLNGPLSRMWLRIEMADDSTLKEGLRKDLQDMQHMVDQFIGFVRGTDPAAYRFSLVPLQEWLTGRIGAWQSTGTAITLTIPVEPLFTINGDAVALARLLDNLIGNALHHGAPPIEVALQRSADGMWIDVCDYGPGIEPERHAEALRPFARLDNARTRSGNVGLGLAWPRPSRAHGGSLALQTADNGGLRVRISLPLAQEVQEA